MKGESTSQDSLMGAPWHKQRTRPGVAHGEAMAYLNMGYKYGDIYYYTYSCNPVSISTIWGTNFGDSCYLLIIILNMIVRFF